MKKPKENSIKVHLLNPKEGINPRRLFMALNLIFSEKDLLHYLRNIEKESKIPYSIPFQNGVLAKNP